MRADGRRFKLQAESSKLGLQKQSRYCSPYAKCGATGVDIPSLFRVKAEKH